MKGLCTIQYKCIPMHVLCLLLKDSCSSKWDIHCTVNHNDLYADSVNTSCYGILDAPMNKTDVLNVQHKKTHTHFQNFMYYR